MLGGNHNGIHTNRLAISVLNGDLALAIWLEVIHRSALANGCELTSHIVSEVNRQRHELFGLIGCVPNHHALIAGTGVIELIGTRAAALFERLVHTTSDIGALLLEGDDHTSLAGIETRGAVVVTDIVHHIAHDALDIDVGFCSHFSEHEYQTSGGAGFASNACVRILLQ